MVLLEVLRRVVRVQLLIQVLTIDLKENVTAISDGITRLKTLKPYRFNFKADADTTVDGFFAHEVTAVPEAISGTKDEVDSDNNPVYQGIDYKVNLYLYL